MVDTMCKGRWFVRALVGVLQHSSNAAELTPLTFVVRGLCGHRAVLKRGPWPITPVKLAVLGTVMCLPTQGLRATNWPTWVPKWANACSARVSRGSGLVIR